MADKVKISDSTSTTSSVIAASLTAVKTAMDKANSAATAASNAQTTATNAYNLANSKQNALGFTPVQQGGGANQGTNKIYLGWDGGALRCQVDSTDLGQIITTNAGKTSVSWADGAWSASVTPNCGAQGNIGQGSSSKPITLPAGGQWAYYSNLAVGVAAGGTTIAYANRDDIGNVIYIRIS